MRRVPSSDTLMISETVALAGSASFGRLRRTGNVATRLKTSAAEAAGVSEVAASKAATGMR